MSESNWELLFTLNKAISEVLNAYGAIHNCPALSWDATGDGVSGLASEHQGSADDPGEMAGRWATEFGLTAEEPQGNGTVTYRGRIEWVPVTVWAITDRVAFDRTVRRLLQGGE